MFSRKGTEIAKAAGAAAVACAAAGSVTFASDDTLQPPHYPWEHNGPFTTFDAASIRRGHQVYKAVCATCHSMNRIAFRNLVNVCYSEEEVKEMAAEIEVVDGPNDEGEMFERPGKLSDKLPAPYENDAQARNINNGALPPDLSLIIKARARREDYIFSLLLGYREPPAGVVVNEAAGQYYNPYFPGGKIGMPKQLQNEGVEYEDGTPATESQQAKDVSTFLAWASEPEHDERKRIGMKWMGAMILVAAITGYYKRFRWSPVKTRKISYTQ